jgi:transcriptional regulator with XRE-family HTH domain
MSKATLLERLTDKEYRDAFVSEEIDTGLPMQIHEMRESRGWKQNEVAEKIGTRQPRFSVMEKPGYGNFSLNTLKKLASVFDVGLIVSFVPFSEMIDFTESLSHKRLAAPGFVDEYARLANRYAKARSDVQNSQQYSLNFAASTNEIAVYSSVSAPRPSLYQSQKTESSIEFVIPTGAQFFTVSSPLQGSTLCQSLSR